MSQYVTKIRTASGDLQIDYNALANLPTTDTTLTLSGQAADAKAVADALDNMNTKFSNPNLLINGDFRNPVNQRGKTSYPIPDNTYTIDRWKVLSNAGTLSVNDGYIKLSSNSSTSSYFIQKIENIPVDDYITVSINVKSLTGALNVYIAGESQEECFSIYSSGITTYTTSVEFVDFMQLNIEAINDAEVELYWAKVEQGSVVTPFLSRIYAEELALCQRYYEKRTVVFFPYGGETPTTYYIAVNGSDHHATKRITPKLSVSAITDYNNSATDVSFVSATQTKDNIRMMTVSSACSQYLLRADIEFDAEFY